MEATAKTDLLVPAYEGKPGGRQFEDDILHRLNQEQELGNCHAGRYGVKMVWRPRHDGQGGVEPQAMASLPDIEGAIHTGRQFIFDAKVRSDTKMSLTEYRRETGSQKSKALQLDHLFARSKMRVICGFLIHWQARKLKTKEEGPETFWFPVDDRLRFWREFLRHEVSGINRAACRTHGFPIAWTKFSSRESRYRPDVLSTIMEIAGEKRLYER